LGVKLSSTKRPNRPVGNKTFNHTYVGSIGITSFLDSVFSSKTVKFLEKQKVDSLWVFEFATLASQKLDLYNRSRERFERFRWSLTDKTFRQFVIQNRNRLVMTTQCSPAIEKTANRKKAAISEESQKKLARTFRRAAVESSFVQFVQATNPCVKEPAELTALAKKLLATELEFIGSPSFSEPSAEAEILGDILLGTGGEEAVGMTAKTPDLPSHLARLCETKLLTSLEEKALFARMNFLRFRANQLKSKIDLESPDEWLIRRIDGLLRAADWHRDCLVKSNMRLVISIVKKFVNSNNVFDDLLSDGIVALIKAVEKFDVGLGFRFSTYATQVVRRNTYRKVMEKQNERQRNITSIHESGMDFTEDQKSSSMSEGRWNELRSKLSLMLDHLDRREKLIIRARFSLGGHRKVQTLQKLADVLGVSKERIRQLEKRALDKLRGMTSVAPLPEMED
jgi:RNA polymerase primary sigma factor